MAGGISQPTAAVAFVITLSKKKARRGDKSKPKMGGIRPRNKLR
jgi:hypothetical protein